MSVPKYGLISTGAPGGQAPPEVQLGGVMELRVHDVGGTPQRRCLIISHHRWLAIISRGLTRRRISLLPAWPAGMWRVIRGWPNLAQQLAGFLVAAIVFLTWQSRRWDVFRASGQIS
jgi:hypothetical protein